MYNTYWKTLEHLVSEEEAIDRIRERLDDSYILLEYAEDMYEIDDSDILATQIYETLKGDTFEGFTAEAIDALPDQVFQDCIDTYYDPHASKYDISEAITQLDGLNHSIFSYQESLKLLPFIDVAHPAPILDDYDIRCPLIETVHQGPMNETQRAYNQLSKEQKMFLVNTANAIQKTMVVDSTQTFLHHHHQYRIDNQRMRDPYGMMELLDYVKDALSQPDNFLEQ